MEAAESLKRLLEEHGLTHQQLADAIGKSRATITNLLRLNELHPEVKHLLLEGGIEMGHARAILGLEFEAQPSMASKVAEKKLSVRATELLIQEIRDGRTVKVATPATKDPDIRRLEDDLSDRFGALVTIRHGEKGGGQVVIRYDSLEQLEGVLQRFQ
jgi:ParB family chromosome partitioning protein